jgi:O-acetyl-ADP-ribose deacetylase (regulator of RNase III)
LCGKQKIVEELQMKSIQADITTLKVDAIVNAANSTLLGGGGVDGAIHRAAGPELLKECESLHGCKTGDAKITKGYLLPARYVIHTVGPVWRGGNNNEEVKLASCYRRCIEIAHEHGLQTIAFPSISTGAYGFPAQRAAIIATKTVAETLQKLEAQIEVVFCCFSSRDLALYEELLSEKQRK